MSSGGEGEGRVLDEETRYMVEMQVLGEAGAGEFRILEQIAVGCNGALFVVECTAKSHPTLSTRYLLKVILKHGLETREIRHFENEARFLSTFPSHPRILRCLRYFSAPATDHIAMHLSDAARRCAIRTNDDGKVEARADLQFLVLEAHPKTLAAVLKEKTVLLSPEKVMKWTKDLLEFAAFMQSRKCAHLNLNLDDIYVKEDGSLCVGGFGTTQRFHSSTMKAPLSPDTFMAENAFHFAPEVNAALSYGCGGGEEGGVEEVVDVSRADVWAIGVLVHEIVMAAEGVPPTHPIPGYPAAYSDYDQLIYPIRVIPTLTPPYTPAFAALVTNLLEPDPLLRPDALDAHAIISTLPLHTIPSTPPPPTLPPTPTPSTPVPPTIPEMLRMLFEDEVDGGVEGGVEAARMLIEVEKRKRVRYVVEKGLSLERAQTFVDAGERGWLAMSVAAQCAKSRARIAERPDRVLHGLMRGLPHPRALLSLRRLACHDTIAISLIPTIFPAIRRLVERGNHSALQLCALCGRKKESNVVVERERVIQATVHALEHTPSTLQSVKTLQALTTNTPASKDIARASGAIPLLVRVLATEDGITPLSNASLATLRSIATSVDAVRDELAHPRTKALIHQRARDGNSHAKSLLFLLPTDL